MYLPGISATRKINGKALTGNVTLTAANVGAAPTANPAYDASKPYVERKDRPEWSAVGMLGVLSVRDDGTCRENEFCTVAEGGIATAADAELSIVEGKIVKAYRVLERVAENVVKVVFR